MDKITLPNGIELTHNDWCKSVEKYAQSKGLENIRVYRSKDLSGYEEYLIVERETAVYASQSYEAIGVHLDIMYLARTIKE